MGAESSDFDPNLFVHKNKGEGEGEGGKIVNDYNGNRPQLVINVDMTGSIEESDELGDSVHEGEDDRRFAFDHVAHDQEKKSAFFSRSSSIGDYGLLASNPTPSITELSHYPDSLFPRSAQPDAASIGVSQDRE